MWILLMADAQKNNGKTGIAFAVSVFSFVIIHLHFKYKCPIIIKSLNRVLNSFRIIIGPKKSGEIK